MATSIYRGPADNLIVGDKLYHPGDAVPMSKDERAWHELNGHRFTDSDEQEIARNVAARPMAAPDTRPRDDRGAPIDMPDAKRAPAAPEIAPPARAAKAD